VFQIMPNFIQQVK